MSMIVSSRSVIEISMRRFCARPSSLSLEATGRVAQKGELDAYAQYFCAVSR